jgi:hypothetical protein
MSHAERQLRRKHPHGLTPPRLAQLVPVSGRALAQRVADGKLPYKDHGPKKHLVPWDVIELIQRHGLGGVERMVRAGKL